MAKIFKNASIHIENAIDEYIAIEPHLEDQNPDLIHEDDLKKAYADGLSEGLCQNEKYLAPLIEAFDTLLASIPKAIADARLNLQQEIADIVLMIAGQFFMNQSLDKRHIESQINQILNQINERESVELHLHPRDIALLQEEAIVLKSTFLYGIKIKNDDSLKLGGCIVKTSQGRFNASIEQQIDQLKAALLKLKQGAPHAPPV